jgi:hypothetical protein
MRVRTTFQTQTLNKAHYLEDYRRGKEVNIKFYLKRVGCHAVDCIYVAQCRV